MAFSMAETCCVRAKGLTKIGEDYYFFNAGSGTNQSNHLFKSGAVHQSVVKSAFAP